VLSTVSALLARRCSASRRVRHWAGVIPTAALVLAGSAAGLAGSAPAAAAAAPPGPVVGPACPNVMMIAARGSGEQPQPGSKYGTWSNPAAYTVLDPSYGAYYGVGHFNYAVYTGLANPGSSLRFALNPARYPADPGPEAFTNLTKFQASAADGAYSIVTEINRARAACGDQLRFVLAGYSQGAWSVHIALYALDAATLNSISAVVLFGDPEFQPGQVIDRGSQNGLGNSGVATAIDVSHRNVPASIRARTASYCLPRDPICQGVSPVNGLTAGAAYLGYCQLVNWAEGKCPHTSYFTSGRTSDAAAFARALLPPPPPPTGPGSGPPPVTYRYYVYHTCANGHCGLNIRTGPGYTHYAVTRVLSDGTAVDIVCQTRGESVSGADGSSSNVWDRLAQGDYAADFYIDTPGMTGSFSPPIPQC
jgi:hypothetical protein